MCAQKVVTLKEQVLDLKQKCYNCKECPLGRKMVDGLDPHVFAGGYVKSDIFFIAEAPGGDEVKLKRPLVGRAGKFFDTRILGTAGIERRNIFATNAVLCRPNEKNRTPLPAEIEICRMHLDAQICLLKPKLLVTLGNVPLFSVCEEKGITKMRGKMRFSRKWSNGQSVPTLPMFHPSYCLRGSGLSEMKEDAVLLGRLHNDILNGKDLAKEEHTWHF
jgi:DNA polymerase